MGRLPDARRGVGEQEAEIEKLRAVCKGLRGRLGVLGRIAEGSGAVDVEMG